MLVTGTLIPSLKNEKVALTVPVPLLQPPPLPCVSPSSKEMDDSQRASESEIGKRKKRRILPSYYSEVFSGTENKSDPINHTAELLGRRSMVSADSHRMSK